MIYVYYRNAKDRTVHESWHCGSVDRALDCAEAKAAKINRERPRQPGKQIYSIACEGKVRRITKDDPLVGRTHL